MKKRTLEKILLLMFFAGVLLVLSMELKSNIRQIRAEYWRKQRKDTNISLEEIQDPQKKDPFNIKDPFIRDEEQENDIEESKNENKEEEYLGDWIAIERKDSYNNELQYYSKDNVVINENTIEITARKETRENKYYTSGLVESTNAYKYGFFEFTIEIDKGKGLFPAIWLLPVKGEALPEIDIFEMIGNEPNIFYGVIHFQENGLQASDYFAYQVPSKDQYSVALRWTNDSLIWYIDQQVAYTSSMGVPQDYMYLIINLAIGGDWPGDPDDSTIFPNQFKILSSKIEPVYMKGRD